MRRIFFDTWAWIALVNGEDAHHKEAVNLYIEIQKEKIKPVTTDYVLAETFSALRKALPIEASVRFGQVLLKDVEIGRIHLEIIDETLFFKTWELYGKYQDKKEISFFDLSSMIVMEELGLNEIFTMDKDFERVGRGYILLPNR